ncbi:translocation/assembly module TamB domain-containing protein [Moraxella nasovis]|uniref:translocation/assembly module TamB domain-containing protein n=1 Tax=Moraxella nasovis TaxID=2904121 RepID=UPI001F60C6E1|nr:translocation/assembly module TamB domain-containing protein [Moraxella nasovis]UNU73514.1 translocation/assembly module TamB domain-containing protein [Moraxella nasovis]
MTTKTTTSIGEKPPSPKAKKPRWLLCLIYLSAAIAALVILVAMLIFYAVSTDTGTKFLLEKIASETGTKLKYNKGNLRHGVWVSDVDIAQGEDITLQVNKAYIQIGWRAVLARQVHLTKADIDELVINNKKPPTGEPFDYATIKLPVDLLLQDVTANKVTYKQATVDPIYVYDIAVKKLDWSGTQVQLTDGNLTYNDVMSVHQVYGGIDLQGDYPLHATADVKINALDDLYVDVLKVKATGSLKHTKGTVTSKYNKHDVHGVFDVRGLEDGSPFNAKLSYDKVLLPYATDQQIFLEDGVITASGVIDNIKLSIDSDLKAKDIPNGRYVGRGVVRDGGMDIPFLQATTANGVLNADGRMEWSDGFELDAVLRGDGYQIRNDVPAEHDNLKPYLPKTLTGSLGVRYVNLDKPTNTTQLEFDLEQQDGEVVQATLKQSQHAPNQPWHIDASWRNLHRTNVPSLDVIHSPVGKASIIAGDGYTQIDAQAKINALSTAPKGDYTVKTTLKGDDIQLSRLDYQGVMGDLYGNGTIRLANNKRPLTWQMNLKTNKLIPNAYFDVPNKTPIKTLFGDIKARGVMRELERGRAIHDVSIDSTDLTAILADQSKTKSPQKVHIAGQGKSVIHLNDGKIQHFDATFLGDVDQNIQAGVDRAAVKLHVLGDMDQININTLNAKGDFGAVLASGSVQMTDGVAWNVVADLDGVDTKRFADKPEFAAILNGRLISSGRYKNDALSNVVAKFNGQITNDTIKNGNLRLDLTGDNNKFNISQLNFNHGDSSLSATGWVDISRGYQWNVMAAAKNFNIGMFLPSSSSNITGGLRTHGRWDNDAQIVAIEDLNVQGSYNKKPVSASGSLYAHLVLPKDLTAYLNELKQATKSKSTEQLLGLRGVIDDKARQAQGIVRSLNANHLNVRMGNDFISMNGNKQRFVTSVSIQDLSQYITDARGKVDGGLILIDDGRALPSVYIDLIASGVRVAGIIIQDASVLGKIVNLGNSNSQLILKATDVVAFGRVLKAVRVDFEGIESEHKLAIKAQGATADLQAKVTGGLNRQTMHYAGVLSDAKIYTKQGKFIQNQPAEFDVGIEDTKVQLASHCWQSLSANSTQGSLCFKDTLSYTPNGGHVNAIIQNLDTSVLDFAMPKDITWQSVLNGKVQAHWQKGTNPTINAVLYSDHGRIGVHQEDVGYTDMPYDRVSVIAHSVPEGLKLRTDIAGAVGRGYVDVVVDPFKQTKPITGALVVNNINLAVLGPFFPELQTLSGEASAAGGVGGTLSNPLFYGNASLKDGNVAIAGLPVNLQKINLDAKIRGKNATIEGSLFSGQGQAQVAGQADWQDDIQAKVRIAGENLDVVKPPLLTAQISPDVEVVVRPSEKYVDIKGVVSVPVATIRPPEASEDIVVESPDVTVLDRRNSGNVDKVLSTVKPWSINVDLGLDLGNDVVFRGFGAKLPLAGALHITQEGQGGLHGLGVIQVSERAKIDGIGQNLELNYAQIRFNGGDITNPRLSIEGEKQIEGKTVGVRVRGMASDPAITVYNDAGLSEQQAMSALVTGRISEAADSQISKQGFRSQVTNNLVAAGLSFGLSGTRNLTNSIGQALGLQSLTVDASGNAQDTSVNVTGYISPDLYIRYGVGVFNADSVLSMRYQLTRRIYVEATSATENTVDVIYRWKF